MPGERPTAAASSSCPATVSAIWAVSNFIVPVTLMRLAATPSSANRSAYFWSWAATWFRRANIEPTNGWARRYLRKLPGVIRPLIRITGTFRCAHRRMKLGQTSSSSRATSVGRSVLSRRSTAGVKSRGYRTSVTSDTEPYNSCARAKPVSVVAETMKLNPGRRERRTSISDRVALISPRLTAWIMTAGLERSRDGTWPMRCENARKTFLRVDGLASQNGEARPTPRPYAMS